MKNMLKSTLRYGSKPCKYNEQSPVSVKDAPSFVSAAGTSSAISSGHGIFFWSAMTFIFLILLQIALEVDEGYVRISIGG